MSQNCEAKVQSLSSSCLIWASALTGSLLSLFPSSISSSRPQPQPDEGIASFPADDLSDLGRLDLELENGKVIAARSELIALDNAILH
jgi:hypothetical protein